MTFKRCYRELARGLLLEALLVSLLFPGMLQAEILSPSPSVQPPKPASVEVESKAAHTAEPSSGKTAGQAENRADDMGMVLTAEQWDRKRSAASVLNLPVLNRVMQAWLQDRNQLLEIQYPGGEEGEFWVQELSDWLVSLGLPSKQMLLSPGSGGSDLIRFRLHRP